MSYNDPRVQAAREFNELLVELADHIDDNLGTSATNAIVSALIIDKTVTKIFRADPRLAAAAAFAPVVTELLKVGFSTQYRGKSFREAVEDRALARIIPIPFGRHLPPVIKSWLLGSAIQSLRDQEVAPERMVVMWKLRGRVDGVDLTCTPVEAYEYGKRLLQQNPGIEEIRICYRIQEKVGPAAYTYENGSWVDVARARESRDRRMGL